MPDDEAVPGTIVLTDEPSARSRLQSSDVILRDFTSTSAGWHWTTAALGEYPGCLVAVAHHPAGRWCLLNIRGFGGLIVHSVTIGIDRTAVDAMARLSYLDLVHARTDRLRADIEACWSPVVVRTVSTDDIGAPGPGI